MPTECCSRTRRGYVLSRIMRRHAPRPPERLARIRLIGAGARDGRADGPGVPRARPRRAVNHRDAAAEETRFKRPWNAGLPARRRDRQSGEGTSAAGEIAFALYAHSALPLELTQDVLRGQGARRLAGFEAAMTRQREQARRDVGGSGEAATTPVWCSSCARRLGATAEFLGLRAGRAEGQLAALVVDGKAGRPGSCGHRGVVHRPTRRRSMASRAADGRAGVRHGPHGRSLGARHAEELGN